MRKTIKYVIAFGLMLLVSTNFSQSLKDSSYYENLSLNFKSYWIKKKENTKLIIFLHGGVKNTIFNKPKNINIVIPLEGNVQFIDRTQKSGFDIFIPIKNDSLNWIDNYEYCFEKFKLFVDSCKKVYSEIYISGFSDGGTGSYRIFYNHPDYFSGLIVFNGFPQLSNFNTTIDYSKIKDKKIFYFGTKGDKRIPYEFLLTEYAKQKLTNPNTFICIKSGRHSFYSYNQFDFNQLFLVLNNKINNTKTEPIHGFVKNDKLISFYKFRKKVLRKYNYGREFWKENKRQKKSL